VQCYWNAVWEERRMELNGLSGIVHESTRESKWKQTLRDGDKEKRRNVVIRKAQGVFLTRSKF